VVIAQAGEDEEEPDAASPAGAACDGRGRGAGGGREENPLPRQGASRRLDPFDADDAPIRSQAASAPPLSPGTNVVVCEAGCDGPRGTVVYRT
jgi:hypothetical protein